MGRQATPAGIQQAKIALTDLKITRKSLEARLNLGRQAIGDFFTGKSVGDETFVRICDALKLDWKTIAGVVGPQTPNAGGFEIASFGSAPPELGAGGLPGIDAIVQQVRSAIEPLIREQCSTMRVLDMDQPIELTGDRGIYTNVNILEKQSRLRSEREFQEDCGVYWYDDRLGLGKRIKRLPGLEVVEKENHRRLMVLGKPGAGKTTFLKYLAMQCITGGFAADRVPFFVKLKHFAEEAKSPSLMEYLAKDLTVETVDRLLVSGYALVFLDGLDEVREEDTKHVIREILSITCKSGENQFIITCRIAAKEYSFEPFTEVEVADFDEEQIATFAENWFRAKNDLLSAETFVQRLGANEPIQELAKTPILLTLLCFVFDRDKDFPTKRVDLYEQGIDLLLEDWDKKRDVQRDRIDRNIDLPFIKKLLSYIAFASFTERNLIEYKQLECYIADFIQTLPSDSAYAELSRIDCETLCKTLIKSLQSHHGILVERAHRTYSFSHLTFQEYFTAREIAAINQVDFLVARIHEKSWREVFLLTVGMMRNSAELLLAMKSHIDLMLGSDVKLQQFLQWVNQKSSSVQVRYKPAAARAFYFALDRARAIPLNLDNPVLRHGMIFNRMLPLAIDPALNPVLNLTSDLNSDRECIYTFVRARDLNFAFDFHFSLPTYAGAAAPDLELQPLFQPIYDRLPNRHHKNYNQFQEWWQQNGNQWKEDFRKITITHRNICHDWQFTDTQKALLQQYYDANLLLVECLNSDGCHVSRSVREEIEATLLLPVEEIEKLRIQN